MPLVRMKRSMVVVVVVVRVESEVGIVGRFRGKGQVRYALEGVDFCDEVR